MDCTCSRTRKSMSVPTVETNGSSLSICLFLPAMLITLAVCISSCRQPTAIAPSWRRIVQSSALQRAHRPSIHPAPYRYHQGSQGAAREFWAAAAGGGTFKSLWFRSAHKTRSPYQHSTRLVSLKRSNAHPHPVFVSKYVTMMLKSPHKWEVWMYLNTLPKSGEVWTWSLFHQPKPLWEDHPPRPHQPPDSETQGTRVETSTVLALMKVRAWIGHACFLDGSVNRR